MTEIQRYKQIFKEMSFDRNQIEQRIFASNNTRLEHLILIYLLPNNSANNHWQSEVYASLVSIARMKWSKNNRYLSSKDYYKNLWIKPFEDNDNYEIIDFTIKDLIYDGYKISKNWKSQKEEIVESLKLFYINISNLMANNLFSNEEVYKLLNNFKKGRK